MTDAGHQRLDQAMNKRRLELHEMTWKQVAERAGLNEFTLQRIRNGKTKLSERSGAKIDRALEWEMDSARRIYYEGGDPISLGRNGTSPIPPIPEGVAVDPETWAIMTPGERDILVRVMTGVRRRQRSTRSA